MTTNKQLRELAEKATPGAWGKDGVYVCTTITAGETIYVQTWNAVAESHQESNAQFIAAANPATILALLDENEDLQAECEKMRRDAELWESIHDEIHRRADKEHALADRCDFGVTIMYEDYATIDAAMQADNPC